MYMLIYVYLVKQEMSIEYFQKMSSVDYKVFEIM